MYSGYVDDPRNTDNAWMETVVYNFHDETGEYVGQLQLRAGRQFILSHVQILTSKPSLKSVKIPKSQILVKSRIS